MSATTAGGGPERPRPFVFDVATTPGQTNVDLLGDTEESAPYLELLGRDLVTRTLVQSDKLCVYHESAQPGERVKPHRHGTYQVNYVLRGELIFGSQRVGPGMGYFSPDMLYSWRAGDEGAEWIEIHSGMGGIFTDRNELAAE
ncbi:MAG: cupin domain-containing protein [Actinomycetota bacterium]|nr:cupin domain-containing protein [Actinomycetota bacterium]